MCKQYLALIAFVWPTLSRNFKFDADTGGDLVITEVMEFHAGLYQCNLAVRVGDSNCEVKSDNASLILNGMCVHVCTIFVILLI